jgi:hypothetical protein
MAPEGNAVFNPVVARQSTAWMSQALLRSLRDIHQQIQPNKELAAITNSLQAMIERVDTALSSNQALSPLLYAGYYHFVYLLEQGDIPYCKKLLADLPCEISGQEVVNGTLQLCHSDMHKSILRNCLYTETLESYWTLCTDQEFLHAREKIQAIIETIKLTQPDFHQEFQSLVTTIVMAKPCDQKFRFDGASSYHLWGLMMLAWDDDKTELEWIETLAHESSHIYLFGLMRDQALLKDDGNNDLYSSPLRADKRPLEGIYHATYVSARMHLAVRHYRHSHSHLFDPNEIERLTAASFKAFKDGYDTIMQHAQLTALGRSVLEDCKRVLEAP